MMQTELPGQQEVDDFLPPLELPHAVKNTPVTVGGLDFPHETEVHRREHHEAMNRVPAVYAEVQDAFERRFGRRPADRVVPYQMDDAEVVFVSMGTTASTAKAVVDAARARGVKAGALRVRMFRPFPEDLLTTWLRGRERVAVLDRDICPGMGGILWSELRGLAPGALVQNYMLGLGGGDIRPEHLEKVLEDLLARDAAGEPQIVEVG